MDIKKVVTLRFMLAFLGTITIAALTINGDVEGSTAVLVIVGILAAMGVYEQRRINRKENNE